MRRLISLIPLASLIVMSGLIFTGFGVVAQTVNTASGTPSEGRPCTGDPPSPPSYYETSTPGVWIVFEYACVDGVWVQQSHEVDHRHPTSTPEANATSVPVTPTPEAATATVLPTTPATDTPAATVTVEATLESTSTTAPPPTTTIVSTSVTAMPPTLTATTPPPTLSPTPTRPVQGEIEASPTDTPGGSTSAPQPAPQVQAQVSTPTATPMPTLTPEVLNTPQPCPFEMGPHGICGRG